MTREYTPDEVVENFTEEVSDEQRDALFLEVREIAQSVLKACESGEASKVGCTVEAMVADVMALIMLANDKEDHIDATDIEQVGQVVDHFEHNLLLRISTFLAVDGRQMHRDGEPCEVKFKLRERALH